MDVTDRDIPTALMHLYRGELGRMAIYRTRLDITTNWAVGTSAALTTFALGQPEAPHFVFGLAVFLVLVFLWMEARRYRFYELVRQRVRLLECGFYGAVLKKTPREGWADSLWESLREPHPPIGYREAVSVRLRRHYLWLVIAIYGAWVLKLWIQEHRFVDAAAIGAVPGPAVIGVAALLLTVLTGIAFSYQLPEKE
ncbi:DUF2270 domain-containing protein [Polyangium aurulentum]|uniref:DUF2270 domain-containing protein n=1 Tax=Polyangium aurulentum TaxID=2567896 RepID=UPI0010AE846F|nr:DUF2270 domain-containing protein [Polyangium aurulentum]UQA54993.1 DUF2270 domain-containing protein [Polyangium aurulentum]